MNHFTKIIAAIAINLPALAATAAAQPSTAQTATAPASLEVSFNGIETTKGNILMVVFDSEAGYNSSKPIRSVVVPADKANVTTLIEGLSPGRYAIKSFHDIDGDNKMGTNPFGMPTEPFAFSNNARGQMGPAKWADASFEVKIGANSNAITIP